MVGGNTTRVRHSQKERALEASTVIVVRRRSISSIPLLFLLSVIAAVVGVVVFGIAVVLFGGVDMMQPSSGGEVVS